MPDADDALADRLTERLGSLPPTTTLLRQGLSPETIIERLLQDFPYQSLGTTPLSFLCSCSQQQTLSLLRTLGADEIDHLIAEPSDTQVTCEYCKSTYTVDKLALQEIRANL
jgi:molecular chaperone Hsp33